MEDIETALSSAVSNLSDQNYTESLAFYRFWIDIGQTYHKIPPDLILDTIWKNRATNSIVPTEAKLIHPTAHLILRLASDAESDHVLAPYSLGLQTRLGSRTLREFFADNLRAVRSEGGSEGRLHAEVNFIAHLANLGYVEEAAIRDHILQSLISHPKLHDHQADALIILFKLAGATFGAIADPSVVDRCLELLKAHSYNPPYVSWHETENNNYFRMKKELVQEVVVLCEHGWEGLPLPPMVANRQPNQTNAGQGDPAVTPVATPLGLPNIVDLEPQTPQTPPLESITVPEADVILPSPTTRSTSTSIATLSDFTIADC